jgi:hypothetical protein
VSTPRPLVEAGGGSGGAKMPLVFSFYVAAVVKPSGVFFLPSILWALRHTAPIGLAASGGVGTSRLQRPSLRAGSNARHPMLSASFDDTWKACRRRPHLSDGYFAGPGKNTGPPPPAPGSKPDSAPRYRLRLFEHGPLW